MVGKPHETVYKITALARWQRNWINSHRSINYSLLVQQMLSEVIKKNDPEYFEKNKGAIEMRKNRKTETSKQFA